MSERAERAAWAPLDQIHGLALQVVLRDGHELPADVYVLTRRIFLLAGSALKERCRCACGAYVAHEHFGFIEHPGHAFEGCGET